jgi:hypothetical protein
MSRYGCVIKKRRTPGIASSVGDVNFDSNQRSIQVTATYGNTVSTSALTSDGANFSGGYGIAEIINPWSRSSNEVFLNMGTNPGLSSRVFINETFYYNRTDATCTVAWNLGGSFTTIDCWTFNYSNAAFAPARTVIAAVTSSIKVFTLNIPVPLTNLTVNAVYEYE